MRGHRLRKERRSAAYFFAEPGLRDFAFGLGTLSTGLVCLTVLGFGVDCFVLFFGMISSWLGASAEPIAGIGKVDRRVAYQATAVTAMRGHRQRKERAIEVRCPGVEELREQSQL